MMKLPIILWMGILLVATSCVSPTTGDSSLSERDKRKFLEMAERWQVPQPSPEATVMKLRTHGSSYALGFIEPGDTNRALVGSSPMTINPWTETHVVLELDPLSLADIAPTSPFFPEIAYNFGLSTGVQLIRRGNVEIGWALIGKGLQEEAGHTYSPLFSPADEKPLLKLARSCLAAAVNDIVSSQPDFADIKQRIETLLKDQRSLRTKAMKHLIKGLEANFQHQSSPAGSVEALIDDYLLAGEHRNQSGFSPAKRALLQKGFEAVPALLKQRHSIRLSNHLMQGFNNYPSYPMNAGAVINGYLQSLANDEFGSDWLMRQKGYVAEDDAVASWWQTASEMGEREYARRFALRINPDGSSSLSFELLEMVKMRHPDLLTEIHESALKSGVESRSIAAALISQPGISRQRKIALLHAAVAGDRQPYRNIPAWDARKIDPTLANRELIRLLQETPHSAAGRQPEDRDAILATLVCRTYDIEVLEAFLDTLGRVDPEMCIELISGLTLPRYAPPYVLRFFNSIHDRYRSDMRIRDTMDRDLPDVPGAGFTYSRLTVGDFVHLHWARLLGLDFKVPAANATPADWAEFRETVGPMIEKEIAEQIGGDTAR